MLNKENANKYLKNFMKKEDILMPVVAEKVAQHKKMKKSNGTVTVNENIIDDSYNLNDIIKECPKNDIVRDFFRFQCENIKDEDNILFA